MQKQAGHDFEKSDSLNPKTVWNTSLFWGKFRENSDIGSNL